MGAQGPFTWLWSDNPPPSHSRPNHTSAMLHRVTLGSQLDQAAAMGLIEYIPDGMPETDFVSHTLPLGARAKPSGAVRMLVDPSLEGPGGEPSMNDCLLRLPCMLTSIDEIFAHVRPGSVLAKRDLTNGFFHVVLAESARRFVGLRHPVTNRLGRWVVLPQGTSQSPAIFCGVTNAACRIFNRAFKAAGLSTLAFVFVDDFILIADHHSDIKAARSIMNELSDPLKGLGLCWNPDKDVGFDSPVTRLEALGLEIDSPTLTLHLPADKRDKYLADLTEFRAQYSHTATCPRKPLERLLGRLVFACKVCSWGFLHVQSIMDALYPPHPAPPVGTSKSGSVALSAAVWHDLSFWADALGPLYPTWMGVKQQHMRNSLGTAVCSASAGVDCELFTDASKSFGVGGVFGLDTLSLQWDRDVSDEHIGALELEALYCSLHHWRDRLRGCEVLCWCDNTQAVVALNKGASRKPALRATLKKIALLGLEAGFHVRARHIKGIFNPADAPSRGMAPDLGVWTFVHTAEFNQPPAAVDCCAAADGGNAVAGTWFPANENLMVQLPSLIGRKLWATVPFARASETIAALVTAWEHDPVRTLATFVVPEWPTAAWYRKYLRRKNPLVTVLHRFPEGSPVFLSATSGATPPCPYPVLVLRLGGSAV